MTLEGADRAPVARASARHERVGAEADSLRRWRAGIGNVGVAERCPRYGSTGLRGSHALGATCGGSGRHRKRAARDARARFRDRSRGAPTRPRPSGRTTAARLLANRRWQLSQDLLEHRPASSTELLITRSTSAVAVCCSSASLVSLNRRAFWIAITAWSAKVVAARSPLSEKRRRACWRRTNDADRLALPQHRNGEALAREDAMPSSSRRWRECRAGTSGSTCTSVEVEDAALQQRCFVGAESRRLRNMPASARARAHGALPGARTDGRRRRTSEDAAARCSPQQPASQLSRIFSNTGTRSGPSC